MNKKDRDQIQEQNRKVLEEFHNRNSHQPDPFTAVSTTDTLPFDAEEPPHYEDTFLTMPFSSVNDKIYYYITVVIESEHRNFVCEIESTPKDEMQPLFTEFLSDHGLSPEQIKQSVLDAEHDTIAAIKAGRNPYRVISD